MIKKITGFMARHPRLRILIIIAAILVSAVTLPNLLGGGDKKTPTVPPSQLAAPVADPQQSTDLGKPILAPAPKEAPQKSVPATNPDKKFLSGLFTDQKPDLPAVPSISKEDDSKPAIQAVNAETARNFPNNPGPGYNNSAGNYAYPSQDGTDDMAQRMQAYLSSSSNNWSMPTMQGAESDTAKQDAKDGGSSTSTPPKNTMIKAGNILLAVLSTALNSDQAGTPVLADVVAGPYKGARLMGSFVREGTALVVQFNLMSMPNWPNTISITAYAIDGETGANALASNVDNHYLLRYGSLFAAGFLQGFGQAYENAQNTGCSSSSTTCIIVDGNNANQVTAKTAAYQGLGQVGVNLGQQIGTNFATPPTVTLNQGSSLGILFMQDVPYPTLGS